MYDPADLGEKLLAYRRDHPGGTFARVVDLFYGDIERGTISAPKLMDKNMTLARETHRRYHDELQERARHGDTNARDILLGRTNDDPGGQ